MVLDPDGGNGKAGTAAVRDGSSYYAWVRTSEHKEFIRQAVLLTMAMKILQLKNDGFSMPGYPSQCSEPQAAGTGTVASGAPSVAPASAAGAPSVAPGSTAGASGSDNDSDNSG